MNRAGIPLQVSVVDDRSAADDAATQVPGVPLPGVPLDPAQVALLERPDDEAPDDTKPSILRAGDSGQTFIGTADGGSPAHLPGFGGGSGDGDASGD